MKLWSLDDSCLFDDLSELQQRLEAKDGGQQAGVAQPVQGGHGGNLWEATSDNIVLEEVVASSLSPMLGSAIGVHTSPTVGSVYMTLDGSELDLLTMTTSCDLTPLVVGQQGLPGYMIMLRSVLDNLTPSTVYLCLLDITWTRQ